MKRCKLDQAHTSNNLSQLIKIKKIGKQPPFCRKFPKTRAQTIISQAFAPEDFITSALFGIAP